MGGEEFVILLSETNLEGAKIQAEKIRKEIADHEFEQVGRVTVSFGLARYRENDTADSFEAMYKAKTSGKNRVEAVDFKTMDCIIWDI